MQSSQSNMGGSMMGPRDQMAGDRYVRTREEMSMDKHHGYHHDRQGRGLWWLIAFIIVWIILSIVMIYWNPPALQTIDPSTGQPSGQVNMVSAVFAAFIVTLILFIILWIARYCCW